MSTSPNPQDHVSPVGKCLSNQVPVRDVHIHRCVFLVTSSAVVQAFGRSRAVESLLYSCGNWNSRMKFQIHYGICILSFESFVLNHSLERGPWHEVSLLA